MPVDQSAVELSPIQAINMSLMSPLARSTEPWLCGWRGLPRTMMSVGHTILSSWLTCAVSLSRIGGHRREGIYPGDDVLLQLDVSRLKDVISQTWSSGPDTPESI